MEKTQLSSHPSRILEHSSAEWFAQEHKARLNVKEVESEKQKYSQRHDNAMEIIVFLIPLSLPGIIINWATRNLSVKV